MKDIVLLILLVFLFDCAKEPSIEFKSSLIDFHISNIRKEHTHVFFSSNKLKSNPFLIEDEETLHVISITRLSPIIVKEKWEPQLFKNELIDISWYFKSISDEINYKNIKSEWKEKYNQKLCYIFSDVIYDSKNELYYFQEYPFSPYKTCGPPLEDNFKYKRIKNKWVRIKD